MGFGAIEKNRKALEQEVAKAVTHALNSLGDDAKKIDWLAGNHGQEKRATRRAIKAA